jgi:predicted TPR repeat methyltransferase
MPVTENVLQEQDRDVKQDLRVALPEPSLRLEQDAEWCLVETPDGWREIRFHDYSEIYDIPGLYERLFYEILDCSSPAMIRSLIEKHVNESDSRGSALRVLDLGAGNGMVGEELAGLGADTIVGVDIYHSAKAATQRDRAGIYTDYLVADMTNLDSEQERRLKGFRFNCLTCVAALGFGDIPPRAFAEAYRLVKPDGLIAFNIKNTFLAEADSSGFSRLIRRMLSDGILTVFSQIEYQHRLATNGDPLHYIAIVGRKEAEIPFDMFE